MLVDVLHQTDKPSVLLREAARVSRQYVILKDHTQRYRSPSDVANDGLGRQYPSWRRLPYNYLSLAEWMLLFEEVSLKDSAIYNKPRLYGAPADWLFGRSLHFIAQLSV